MATSGVGVQSRFLIDGLLSTGKWSFKCLGAAVKHDNYDIVKISDDFLIKPINGFGNHQLVNELLYHEKPDLILLFTDPRFFPHIFESEDTIHRVCPIAYNHIWDNDPYPEYNKSIYDCVDLINCINWPIYSALKDRYAENRVNYIPHSYPLDMYKPLADDFSKMTRRNLLGDRANRFTLLWVARNAHRKMPGDLIFGWSKFINRLKEVGKEKDAMLLMHTNPLDQEGPNLFRVVDNFKLHDSVMFSSTDFTFDQMNAMYNSVDCVINVSKAEGFGLPILEAKLAGKPIIASTTGGLTRQVVDHETGFEYGVGINPKIRSLVGNQQTPYIFEDCVSSDDICDAIWKMYNTSKEDRRELGLKARDHALKNYDYKKMIEDWDKSLTSLVDDWKVGKRRTNRVEIMSL